MQQHPRVTKNDVLDVPGARPVHRIGFGAMQLAGPGVFGPPADPQQAEAVLRRALELGVDHIDTSDFYGPWVVNELIARVLRPYPEELLIATKVGAYRDREGGWPPLVHPAALKAAVHDNLRRLQLDRMDLVYLRHSHDHPDIPFADQVGALVELQREGLVGGIGLSNVSLEQFEQARAIAPIAAVQNAYNVVDRTSADLLDRTAELGVPFVPFFPLGSAFLPGSRALGDQVVRAVAERRGAKPAQVSLAWLLHRAPNTLLIPGTSSLQHLADNCAAAQVELTGEDVRELAGLVAEGDAAERPL